MANSDDAPRMRRPDGTPPAWAEALTKARDNARQLRDLLQDESVAVSRRQWLQAATREADAHLRSPEFLQAMKQQLAAVVELRRQAERVDAANLPADPWRKEILRAALGVSQSPSTSQNKPEYGGVTPYEVADQSGALRLLHFQSDAPARYREPVLICYSLVNRPYILDLRRDRSVVQQFLSAGFDVYLIDWGVPTTADQYKCLADYVCGDLARLGEVVCRRSRAKQFTLFGYCMGGTMSAMYAAHHPRRVRNLVLMAAPIAFDEGSGLLHLWSDPAYFDVDALIDAFGNFPGELLQFGFQIMQPVQNFHEKYLALLQNLDDEEFLINFQTMERWINDNIPVAGETFREFVKKLYQENQLLRGEFRLQSQPVDLGDIACPLLLITAEHDHLVPPPATLAIADHAASREIEAMTNPSGHVGLAVGRAAHGHLWPAACRWLGERSSVCEDRPRR